MRSVKTHMYAKVERHRRATSGVVVVWTTHVSICLTSHINAPFPKIALPKRRLLDARHGPRLRPMRAMTNGNVVERHGAADDDEVFLTSGGFSDDEPEQEDEPAEVLRVYDERRPAERVDPPETSLDQRIEQLRDAMRSYGRAEKAYDFAETQARERRRRARREALRSSLRHEITIPNNLFETSDRDDPRKAARDFVKHARDVYARERALSRRFASVASIELCLDDSQRLLSIIG